MRLHYTTSCIEMNVLNHNMTLK